jgi:hypothetical protein
MDEKEILIRYIEALEKGREIEKEFIKCFEKSHRRNFFITMASMILFFFTICAFLIYLYQYDFSADVTTTETTTIEQDSGEGGSANYIEGGGTIINGETKDNKN